MMEDEKKYSETRELLGQAQAHPDWEIANYFQRGFSDHRLSVTREGIWDRMNALLSSSVFRRWFCYPSHFDLASAIERRQAILFDLSAADSEVQPAGIPICIRPPFQGEAGHHSDHYPATRRGLTALQVSN
jgi:hypothetical protein